MTDTEQALAENDLEARVVRVLAHPWRETSFGNGAIVAWEEKEDGGHVEHFTGLRFTKMKDLGPMTPGHHHRAHAEPVYARTRALAMAAPDLLAALKDMLAEVYARVDPTSRAATEMAAAIGKAEAAIAKATGGA